MKLTNMVCVLLGLSSASFAEEPEATEEPPSIMVGWGPWDRSKSEEQPAVEEVVDATFTCPEGTTTLGYSFFFDVQRSDKKKGIRAAFEEFVWCYASEEVIGFKISGPDPWHMYVRLIDFKTELDPTFSPRCNPSDIVLGTNTGAYFYPPIDRTWEFGRELPLCVSQEGDLASKVSLEWHGYTVNFTFAEESGQVVPKREACHVRDALGVVIGPDYRPTRIFCVVGDELVRYSVRRSGYQIDWFAYDFKLALSRAPDRRCSGDILIGTYSDRSPWHAYTERFPEGIPLCIDRRYRLWSPTRSGQFLSEKIVFAERLNLIK